MSRFGPGVRSRDWGEKTLLVSSEPGGPVANSLADVGRRFTTVPDGTAALHRLRQERFELVVVVSTGKEMDLVETVLNIRDIRPSMPLIILRNPTHPETDSALQGIISLAVPKIAIVTLEEFQRDLDESAK